MFEVEAIRQQFDDLMDEAERLVEKYKGEANRAKIGAGVIPESEYPKINDYYWFISGDGDVMETRWYDQKVDQDCKEIGNCFRTKSEAEQAVEKLKAWKRLKDAGTEIDDYSPIYLDDAQTHWAISVRLKFPRKNEVSTEDLDLLFGGK